jgi:hypothetical protein
MEGEALISFPSDRIDIATVTKAESVSSLETRTQEIITSVLQNGREINASISATTLTLTSIQTKLEAQHTETITTLTATAQNSDGHAIEEHVRTREELVRMTHEATVLRRDMEREFAEIKVLIEATAKVRGEKEQKKLKEKTTAVSAAWFAKEIIYTNIMVCRTTFCIICGTDRYRDSSNKHRQCQKSG